jgi:UPF0755 protein
MWRALAILLSIGCIVGAGLVVYLATDHAASAVRLFAQSWGAPVSDDPTPRVFTVRPGMSAREVGDELERQQLIRSSLVFRMLVDQLGVGEKIPAGDYELRPNMSTQEIVQVLASGRVKRQPAITVVEGWRAEEIAARLAGLHLASADDFLALVHDPAGVTIPSDLPLGGSGLEGFLFPATYEWDPHTGLVGLVNAMLRQFDEQVTPELRAGFAHHGLTLRQGIILASIVEREASRPDERPVIASVYENRLAAGMPLQADPTVQYAVASADLAEASQLGFWRPLQPADLELDSPYNTYTIRGLPPAPICNPGLASIRAVAEPADTDYLYFVARGDGSHAFARTNAEHLQNVQKYQQ